MTLYRIEPARRDFSCSFIPKVPYRIAEGEDNTTERICVARNITDCIYSAPYGIYGKVPYYSIFRVFEFEIDENDENFLDTEEIVEKVPNVLEGTECWITRPITANRVYYISCISNNNGMGIDYKVVNESELYNIIDLSGFDEGLNLELGIKCILNNGFDDFGKLINKWEIKGENLYIDSDYYFWGNKFKEIMVEEY